MQSQFVSRVPDFLDDTGVTGPLDVLAPDGDQVVALPHTSDLKQEK